MSRFYGSLCTLHIRIRGCVAQLAERRSSAAELTMSCARPAADGCPLFG